jgi:hypothetical protein
MRRPSVTRLTVAALEVALGYLRTHVASGETPEPDRAELRRAIGFLEDLIAHKKTSPPKQKGAQNAGDPR